MSNSAAVSTKTWAGGRSPFNVSYGKLMMWVFLLSDAFTFTSLLVGYGAIRFSYSGYTTPWPDPSSVFNHFPFAFVLNPKPASMAAQSDSLPFDIISFGIKW